MKALACMAMLLAASGAQAQVGITQALATGSGIGTGDSPGFPVTIVNSGSYKLFSNLNPPSGVDAIDITADFVTLDLNGYTIAGYETCSIVPPNIGATCVIGSFGTGVSSTGANTTIKNGAINGFSTGLYLAGGADAADISKLALSQNDIAMYLSSYGAILQDVQEYLGTYGLVLGANAIQVHNSYVGFNGVEGIQLSNGIISHLTAASNSSDGVNITNAAILRDSTLSNNGRHGVFVDSGTVLTTDSTAYSNGADGFYYLGAPPSGLVRSLLLNLNAVGNGSYGYELQSTTCYYHVAGESNATNLTGGTALIGTTCP
jgi:hypothetical protein